MVLFASDKEEIDDNEENEYQEEENQGKYILRIWDSTSSTSERSYYKTKEERDEKVEEIVDAELNEFILIDDTNYLKVNIVAYELEEEGE